MIGAAAVVLLNGALIVWFRGDAMQFVAVVMIVLLVGAPAALVAWVTKQTRSRLASVAIFATWVAVVALSSLLSLMPGRWLANQEVAAAKHYCEQLAGTLDAYRRDHGAFPATLVGLPTSDAPELARIISYWSDGQTFTIDMADPRWLLSRQRYQSIDRRWQEWH
jgi:hypothetical protein